MTAFLSERPESLQVLLEEGASFEGELRFHGTARLSGRFKGVIRGSGAVATGARSGRAVQTGAVQTGAVQTGGVLIIEPSASVDGSLFVDHLILKGCFDGEARAEKSALMEPPAQFKGEIQTPSLSIQEGVVFEGVSKKPNGKTESIK